MTAAVRLVAAALLAAATGTEAVGPGAAGTEAAGAGAADTEAAAMAHEEIAAGRFDVRMDPAAAPDPGIASWTLVKTFHGTLEATGRGQMLSAGDPARGAAGYVALEQVTGTLAGRRGGFALQHSGTLMAGTPTLVVAVVPGSGSGGLLGLAGTMTIDVAGGQHRYTLHYTLPE